MGRFEGRVALVTGAGSGLGRAVSTLLAAEGSPVACLDIAPDSAEKTGAAIAMAVTRRVLTRGRAEVCE